MRYGDYEYKKLIRDIEQHELFVKSTELREWSSIHTVKTVLSSDGNMVDFPPEKRYYFEIIIEVVSLDGKKYEYMIDLDTYVNREEARQEAIGVYAVFRAKVK